MSKPKLNKRKRIHRRENRKKVLKKSLRSLRKQRKRKEMKKNPNLKPKTNLTTMMTEEL